ncbi:collagen-like protein [Muricauda oceani]|uniref:collagen-like protein n=1 Tax=Flagellimonas oceani TaxID=2698672 RepID=UPI00197B18FD|nr:collagen-like protein [Allomuricauda oceani]MBW8243120.1 collagen-like protein [Allomuricauda oceani]
MKVLKLCSIAMLAMSITLVSCSGEDGETGPIGPAGPQGEQGEQGPQGEQGEQGNANVRTFDYLINDYSSDTIEITLTNFIDEGLDVTNFALLFYLESTGDPNDRWYSIPGPIDQFQRYTKVIVLEQDSEVKIDFFNVDHTPYVFPAGKFNMLRIVAIDLGNGTAKTSKEDAMSELKSAGVDTSDYNQVAAYFGLN